MLPTLRSSRTPASDGSRRISGKSSKRRVSHRQNSTCSPSSWAIQDFERPLDKRFSRQHDCEAATTISTHALPFSRRTGTSRMSIPQMPVESLMIWNNTGLIGLRIRSRHLKTVLMHNIRQMSVVAFSTVHVKYLTTVISTNIK